jgi:hypothetical protein
MLFLLLPCAENRISIEIETKGENEKMYCFGPRLFTFAFLLLPCKTGAEKCVKQMLT